MEKGKKNLNGVSMEKLKMPGFFNERGSAETVAHAIDDADKR